MGRELTTSRSRVIGSSDGASQASQRVRSRDLVGTLTECWDADFPGTGEQRQRQGFVSRRLFVEVIPSDGCGPLGRVKLRRRKSQNKREILTSSLNLNWDSGEIQSCRLLLRSHVNVLQGDLPQDYRGNNTPYTSTFSFVLGCSMACYLAPTQVHVWVPRRFP